MSSGIPFDRSFLSNRLALTLSNATDTSEQYTPILRVRPKSEIQIAARCAKASLAFRSGIYANWLHQKRLYESTAVQTIMPKPVPQLYSVAKSNGCACNFARRTQNSYYIAASSNVPSISLAIRRSAK